ncbi:RNA polymerase II-associated protein 1 [Operophtera brumata]|uniref:RNA polymerase II-associated protein 1 n=1 Tax=Operophtera brumata TaxID=104452 RepID=A0A0L7LMF0_OPEBR|nr:RNA polymerase II-associated protein 1 [Operophtera brumata]
MIKRPKPGEDEEDLLKMQEEYLQQKNKDPNYKPAAAVTNLRKTEITKRPSTAEIGTRKPSKYALSKGLQRHSEKRPRTDVPTSSVIGDILEKNFKKETPKEPKPEAEDDKVYFPAVKLSVLGNIIEKNLDVSESFYIQPMPSQGFPEVLKRDPTIVSGQKSIHIQHLERIEKLQKTSSDMDIDEPSTSIIENVLLKSNDPMNFPSKSYIISSKEADEIHTENIKMLSKMSQKEILEERQKLLTDLDPKILEFIKAKRQKSTVSSSLSLSVEKSESIPEKMETSEAVLPDKNTQSNTKDNKYVPSTQSFDSLWDNDILTHPEISNWLNFDSLENDKLEWMKGIEESKKVRQDEPFEARFDFKGYLLPYTMEYTEKTKTLFHHGDEPHRPGYSIMELIELSRSALTQQRVMALNTLAGILEYNSVGTYKDIIELPLSKIFFIIRIAMDENKVIILEPALKAMRNLLYNRIDEASLDALLGFEEGMVQPCLENDKSEIEELQSKESELKDFHLAEIDLIAAALRTDILQRLYYILDIVKPSFNCVHYSLQILTRLARDSVETASRIVMTEHLMQTILKNFVPTTSLNFVFDPQVVYNRKPILSAVRLLRILSLQSDEISNMLVTKYEILTPISEYISSGVDRTYGLRVQIEAYSLLSNLLCYGQAIAISLFPVLITTLYKHVQGTDIFASSPINTATHAAVVLQLLNRLLACNLTGTDDYKSQIYPLLKEGTQKWMQQLSQSDVYTCAHVRLLCSALDCCKTVLLIENIPIKFLNDSLKHLSSSRGFKEIVKNIVPSSNLLSGLENKDLHLVKNLASLGASVIDSEQKVLPILNVVSPLPFLASLFKLLLYVNDNIIAQGFLQHLTPYLKKLAKKPPSLADNWFTRIETDLVFNILKLSIRTELTEQNKDLLYAVGNKLCYVFRIDKRYELVSLFEKIIFNKKWFTAERMLNLVNISDAEGFSKAIASIEDIKVCYSKVINLDYRDTGPNVVLLKWQEPILPRDWIYLPILSLYSKSQEVETGPKVVGEHAKKVAAQIAAEKEFIINCSLEWILFNELCFQDLLNDIDVTDRFCRIMCVFLCDQSLFLDARIKVLLRKCALKLFQKKEQFNFDKQLVGLHNFQDFYTQFLEQFQSVSYGDNTFAACVLVPLAQKHNVKWRKLIWSEYAGCLRALDCPEELLCYELKDYLYPEETDETVIKSYFQALSGNLLRPNTIAHKIAQHHVECYKNRTASANG